MEPWWPTILAGVLAVFALTVLAMVSRNRWGLTINETATLILASASLGTALLAYQQSQDNRDVRDTIGKLTYLGQQSYRQANALRRQMRELRRQTKEMQAQTKALTSTASSAFSIADTNADQVRVSTQALLADRAADVAVDARNFHFEAGSVIQPGVVLFVRNTGKTVIHRAEINVKIDMLGPNELPQIWQGMEQDIQTLELGGEGEPEVLATLEPLTRDQINRFNEQRLAVVVGIIIRWQEPGKRAVEVRSKCYTWSRIGTAITEQACPNLAETRSAGRTRRNR